MAKKKSLDPDKRVAKHAEQIDAEARQMLKALPDRAFADVYVSILLSHVAKLEERVVLLEACIREQGGYGQQALRDLSILAKGGR